MKALLTLVTLFSISTTAFAFGPVDCSEDALNVAKLNLDSKAVKYGFPESSVQKSTLKKSRATANGSAVYSMSGFIYKATYNVEVGMDASCSVESVTIKEQ